MTDQQFWEHRLRPYAPNREHPAGIDALDDGAPWEVLNEAQRAEVATLHRNYISEEEVD